MKIKLLYIAMMASAIACTINVGSGANQERGAPEKEDPVVYVPGPVAPLGPDADAEVKTDAKVKVRATPRALGRLVMRPHVGGRVFSS